MNQLNNCCKIQIITNSKSKRVLIVDECRHTGGGPSAHILAGLLDHDPGLTLRRIASHDSFIPLGGAANVVLLQLMMETDSMETAIKIAEKRENMSEDA